MSNCFYDEIYWIERTNLVWSGFGPEGPNLAEFVLVVQSWPSTRLYLVRLNLSLLYSFMRGSFSEGFLIYIVHPSVLYFLHCLTLIRLPDIFLDCLFVVTGVSCTVYHWYLCRHLFEWVDHFCKLLWQACTFLCVPADILFSFWCWRSSVIENYWQITLYSKHLCKLSFIYFFIYRHCCADSHVGVILKLN